LIILYLLAAVFALVAVTFVSNVVNPSRRR